MIAISLYDLSQKFYVKLRNPILQPLPTSKLIERRDAWLTYLTDAAGLSRMSVMTDEHPLWSSLNRDE